jgi:hypothetical protein
VPASTYLTAKHDLELNLIDIVKSQSNGNSAVPEVASPVSSPPAQLKPVPTVEEDDDIEVVSAVEEVVSTPTPIVETVPATPEREVPTAPPPTPAVETPSQPPQSPKGMNSDPLNRFP